MLRSSGPILVLMALAWPGSAVHANPAPSNSASHPIVPGFERFYGKGHANAAQGGRLLLTELNCTSCHHTGASNKAALRRQAPVLDGLGSRVKRSYLRKFLSDPQACKPGTPMPRLFADLPEQERQETIEALVHFLASTGSLAQERAERKVMTAGRDLYHKVGCVACHGTRDAAGDALHLLPTSLPLGDLRAKYSLASLRKFLENPLAVRPSGRMPHLLTAKEARDVANYLLQGLPVEVSEEHKQTNLQAEAAMVVNGRTVFAAAGCASCHDLHDGKKIIASTLVAPPLAELRPEGGCLDKVPAKGLPRYNLSPGQRTALSAALKSPAPATPSGPAEIIARTLTTFNCYACHQRDRVGGVEDGLNAAFTTSQQEMGEEGRIPPALDGVGAKLTPAYLRQILDRGAHDRPYMHTRMPGFGAANVGALVTAFAAVDNLEPVANVTFSKTPARVKADARHLVGGLALGCVKCHTFAGIRAEGVQGIDMTLMAQRLRRDWFHRYVADPQKFRPGTRMPAAWVNGQSPLPDILAGSADRQIEAIWLYLSDGRAARPPAGIGRHYLPLVPDKEAIIYRNFIQGGGTRAIAVGYPEQAHLCFDANNLRLAMIWQGAFIDAARHWTDRGDGFQPPLGDDIVHLPDGPAFAVLGKDDEPWPTKPARALPGYRFRGYRLAPDQRPTFLYAVPGALVEDVPNPVAGKAAPSLHSCLTLTAVQPTPNLWFRAAAANKIESLGDGRYRIDGEWTLRIESDGTPRLRQSGGKTELLVPVLFHAGRARIVEDFVW